jgi:hypothetical protein
MMRVFESNDGAIWAWRDDEWILVCDQIEPTVVYRDYTGQFFQLGLRTADGREFRLSAGNLYSRRPRDLESALRREGIRVFDLALTAQYLHTTMPVSAIEDPRIPPSTASGCHAEFRKCWERAKRV